MTELIPDWKERGAPLNQPVTDDAMVFLGEKSSFRTPNFLLPQCFQNHGNYIVSLGNVTRWLAEQAEGLGVEIFPGFPAAEVLYNDDGSVKGVATGNMGVGKDDEPTDNFQLGMELHAKYTIFAEGARGHLGRQLHRPVQARRRADPQSLWHRRQGAVGDRPGAPPARLRAAHRRLADGQPTPTAAPFSTTWKTTR